MQGLAFALFVVLILAIVFVVVGLPLIKEIEESRIQRLLIVERMAQHRQQTTLIIGGLVGFVLLSVVFGYFLFAERDRQREHQRWMAQNQLPPPTIVLIGNEGRPNRGTALQVASRATDLTARPTIVDLDKWEEQS